MKKNPILLGVLAVLAVVAGTLSLRSRLSGLRKARSPGGKISNAADLDESGSSVGDHPSLEDIARLAQHYWEEEGCPEGRAQEHWRRAEEELGRHFSGVAPTS